MNVRAKFRIDSITQHAYNSDVRTIKLYAVSADEVEENKRYHKYTPSGTLEITIDNPPAAEQFKLGSHVYLDFSDAP